MGFDNFEYLIIREINKEFTEDFDKIKRTFKESGCSILIYKHEVLNQRVVSFYLCAKKNVILLKDFINQAFNDGEVLSKLLEDVLAYVGPKYVFQIISKYDSSYYDAMEKVLKFRQTISEWVEESDFEVLKSHVRAENTTFWVDCKCY
ncbi:hypothetical protein QVD17_17671 [Tagetes erecta]|uniref:DUF659 domain-containing protein n=1 Tax=Tagetes erecta TaxID=13708 RepID=A0AAD8KX52_TARER|nr:hypothetical protein QVD17_17671 [Tagetes erecta]